MITLAAVPTPLSQHVWERFQRQYGREPTARLLADASEGKFGHATAAKLLNGTHGNVEEETLQGLAKALREPLSALRRILGQPVHDLGDFKLPARANRLTSKERQAIVSVVDAILSAHDRSERHADDGPGLRAVARKRGDKRGR